MKILKTTLDKNILINNQIDTKNDIGWSESFVDYENELKNQIINSIENYETVRYIHESYSGITEDNNLKNSDIWFYFYFLDGSNYVQNYLPTGLSNNENSKLTSVSTNSFFRLEFYKTLNEESPSRENRKLVFAKNLMIPSGEKFFYTANDFNNYIFLPVFYGNNYQNKENMYIFWFQDETPYQTSSYTGNTFWMTAKYFNSVDGTLYDFVNDCFSQSHEITENEDLYYKVILNMSDYTYKIYEYNGTQGVRAGTVSNPIKFYEKGGGTCI